MLISAIDGVGGIGKTALAIRFAHQIAERYPDGQLYVNLRGFDPSLPPLSTGEALAQLLRGLGVSRMPVDVEAQAALYRSLLADRRMSIALDSNCSGSTLAYFSAIVAPHLYAAPLSPPKAGSSQ